MKIGITCHPSAGGSGILATELGIALADRGHTVHFVTNEPPFRLKGFRKNLFSHYVNAVSYPLFHSPPYSLTLATRISEIAEEHEIELWHAHYAIPNAAAALFARDMLPEDKRFCLVTTLHGTDITLVGSDPSFFRITKYAMERSCAVTAVSQWLTLETEREFQLSRPVRTIHNFFDPEKFAPRRDEPGPIPKNGRKFIMHISNFRPVKRVTDVVRTFQRIAEAIPEAHLLMVGEGPERMAAVGVARQLGLSGRITYLGNYSDMEALLPSADLVFQPSEHESFGLVPLEAMACEVPVLGTASGGVVEVVEHGVTGYLCEVGNNEMMARYAIDILSDEEKAREMGRRGRERALAHFSRDDIVAQYEALYEEVFEEFRAAKGTS